MKIINLNVIWVILPLIAGNASACIDNSGVSVNCAEVISDYGSTGQHMMRELFDAVMLPMMQPLKKMNQDHYAARMWIENAKRENDSGDNYGMTYRYHSRMNDKVQYGLIIPVQENDFATSDLSSYSLSSYIQSHGNFADVTLHYSYHNVDVKFTSPAPKDFSIHTLGIGIGLSKQLHFDHFDVGWVASVSQFHDSDGHQLNDQKSLFSLAKFGFNVGKIVARQVTLNMNVIYNKILDGNTGLIELDVNYNEVGIHLLWQPLNVLGLDVGIKSVQQLNAYKAESIQIGTHFIF